MTPTQITQVVDPELGPPSRWLSRWRGRWAVPWLGTPWVLGICIVLAICALYANSLQGGWIYDDYSDVLGNAAVQKLWPLREHFLHKVGEQAGVASRPLVTLTFALNFLVGKNDPFVYHCTNVGVHALAALTLFGLIRRTLLCQEQPVYTPREGTLLAFMVALLWGIHPLQVESVAYITQRYESLMGLFVMLTLLSVVRAAHSCRAWVWQVGASVSCALALASKEVAVSLPLLVLLYDRAFLAGTFAKAWRSRRPMYLGLGVSWALFALNQANVVGREWAGFRLEIPWWQYAINQPAVILHYLRLVIWPHPLILDYGWVPAASLGPLIPGFVVIGSLLMLTLIATMRAPRWGFLGAFFFLILAPTSSVMPILDLAVEHRMYLPLAPVVAVMVMVLRWAAGRLGTFRQSLVAPLHYSILAIGAAVVAMLASLTFLRSDDFRSSLSITFDTVTKRPANARAYINYARALFQAGKLDDAIRQVKIAVGLAPNNGLIRMTLGVYLEMKGCNDEAIHELTLACQLSPKDARGWMALGEIFAKLKKTDKSIAFLREALQLEPWSWQVHSLLGDSAAQAGWLNEALGYYDQTLRLRPAHAPSVWGKAHVKLRQGCLAESQELFEFYVRLSALAPDAWVAVGHAYYSQGYPREALCSWRRALMVDPKHSSALISSAWVLSTSSSEEVRNGAEALNMIGIALKTHKDRSPAVLDVLGAVYAELGRFPEACAVLDEALWIMKESSNSDSMRLRARLMLYQAGHPCREGSPRGKS